MKLVLASGSERRNYLLSWLEVPFIVKVSEFDEDSVKEKNPKNLVKRLALEKAQVVVTDLKQSLVIGADTVVAIENEVIGKPKNEKDAVRILKKLSGKTHEVYTGVAVISTNKYSSKKKVVGVDRTKVTFRKLSEKEIKDYVATGEPMDKGGAYAIQMGAAGFVSKVEGSYTNVVGLPLILLEELLAKQGYIIEKSVSRLVFKKTGYWS